MIITPVFIISILLVFVLVWWFATTIDSRKWVSFLISVVLTPFLYFYVVYAIMNIFSSYHHEKYFVSKVWKEKPAFRYEMVGNLLQDSLLVNRTKEDVKTLLGKSEWFSWNDSIKANSKEQWNYNLGVKPGAFNNMQECLEIIFNDDLVSQIREYQLKQVFEKED
ncbi:hypothetical protein E1J38_012595 [Seonamhaeicola sediminis]|uniref:Uncharacterized protein n=1 Tax=Seonamhaeicola sediminis TaxID=2528206 RepID=A0A562YCA1_9FLAO|nr:hypothetical protein [Seonamhaeicola sediminis]TWO31732.1 hypothetical protein E1J38_012595 [Seonamhaeicola sediminis]